MARLTESVQQRAIFKQHQLLPNGDKELANTTATTTDLEEASNDNSTDGEDEPAQAPASKRGRRLAQNAVFKKLLVARFSDDMRD